MSDAPDRDRIDALLAQADERVHLVKVMFRAGGRALCGDQYVALPWLTGVYAYTNCPECLAIADAMMREDELAEAAPTLLARHIDAAGGAGIKRWQLWDKTNRDQVWDARSMDAALAPLLACGAYEAVRRSTGGRAATVYRRVQPRQETRA